MGLDGRGSGATAGLDHVGEERALDEEACLLLATGKLGGLLLEDAYELGADRFALGLGLGDTFELLQKTSLRVDCHKWHLEGVPEGLYDLFALVLAHQTVVNEHAGELIADRAVHEQCGDRGVDAAG